MFNWEMDSSAEVNRQSKAKEAVAKVTTTTRLKFEKKKKKDKLKVDFWKKQLFIKSFYYSYDFIIFDFTVYFKQDKW